MNPQLSLRLQVLEKIGAPLMAAILAAANNDGPEKDAQTMAALLARSVQAGVALSQILETAPAAGGDALRLALTALAAPLLADHFRRQGSAPGDAEISRLTSTLQTVIPFAENFPAAQAVSSPDSHPLALLQIFVPVAAAIQKFSFGQPETKLLSEVAQKLVARAGMMRADLLNAAATTPGAEHAILRALADLYCAAHQEQTARMTAQGTDNRSAPEAGLLDVWKNFEIGADMIQAMAETLIPGLREGGGEKSGGGSGGQKPASDSAQARAEPPTGSPMSLFAKKPGSNPPAQDPPSQNSSPPPASNGNPGSPMSFFKKGG